MIFEETGFQPDKIDFDLTKPVGVFSRAADLSRTRACLGWEPSTRFRDGLRTTIRWYYETHDRQHVAAELNRLLTER
jgi:nucleoside-diphosphate-sugar epimerase